jgi:hypothetical protein
MTADRKQIIKGIKIEEYYWNGKMVVYVDNRLSTKNYEEEIAKAEKEVNNERI